MDMTDDGAWHVSAAREGMGKPGARMVYYVQRYVRPQEGRRYTGDIATRTWLVEAEAQAAADQANAGAAPFTIRGTYL